MLMSAKQIAVLKCPTPVVYFVYFLTGSTTASPESVNLLKSFTIMTSTPPHNFSWVEPDKLAGLALPRMTSEYQYLLDNGIKHLVCLCERKPPYHDSCPELQLHHIKIADFTPPSPSQIDRFLSVVEEANSKGEGVAVHCMHGHGRTGTMLACYLVKTRKISGIDAINEIRTLRRGSIETHEQEKAVVQFYQRTK
ncbi:dual specificity protein phosphatase 23b isoform X1 [Seriola aureovittata]|uniref:Dual specificity protein phosphatase 23 n=2 Tax=Seriola lalandi dorsalis TaxID=1841481 RepID=A0A3B4WPV1_SERLL|nr:dual specificity protein phosphatase 23b isoform X1 [Seriola aureovittata]